MAVKTLTLTDILRELVEVTRTMKEFDDLANNKLTDTAFVAEARDQARLTEGEVERVLHQVMEGLGLEVAKREFRKMVKLIKGPSCTRAKFKRFPTNYFCDDEAKSELAVIKATPQGLWAAAASWVSMKHPEVFGEVRDFDAHMARLDALKARQQELFKLVETSFTADDVMFLETSDLMHNEGYTRMGFKCTGGAVALGRDAGQRLVDWLLAHPEAIP
jgi:hypothetical protein